MFMFRPLAAAIVASMADGTLGFFAERAIRRLLMVPGIPGKLGGGSECCNEPARMAAAAAAACCPEPEALPSPAEDDEETLKPLEDVLTSLPAPFSAVDEEADTPLRPDSPLLLRSISAAELLSLVLFAKKSFGLRVISAEEKEETYVY